MQMLTLKLSTIGAWITALVYNWIRVHLGVDVWLLLCVAVIILVFGLYTGCKENKETTKGEA